MDRQWKAMETQLRHTSSSRAETGDLEMGEVISMPIRRGRLRLIKAGDPPAPTEPGAASASKASDFESSVLIGWAADGEPHLEVRCITGQHLQTLMNAVMELEVLILETRSKQERNADASDVPGPISETISASEQAETTDDPDR